MTENNFPYKVLLVRNQEGPLEILTETRFKKRALPALGMLYADLAEMASTDEHPDGEEIQDYMNSMSCISAHLLSLRLGEE